MIPGTDKKQVDEKSQEWVHVLKLHSQLPFRLVKQVTATPRLLSSALF
jgi:hypothetical protein